MKILWHSNAPWAPTGYGQQSATFVPRIRDLGHDVAFSAFWGLGGARLEWEGMPVFPADDKWGNRNLRVLADHHGGGERCLIITLMDVWVLESPALEQMPDLAAWVPIDHAPAPPKVLDFFHRTGATPIAMSQFGVEMLTNAGLQPLYVPHGIDCETFQPRPNRAATRGRMGIPEDAFVVGMVAANKGASPSRKSFPQVFLAFSQLRKQHEDAVLYLHTELSGQYDGINLGALAAACGIPLEAIKYTPQFAMDLGIEPTLMSEVYSAFDVLANPSYGEGFGVPIVEAQACGTPVIVTDWTAMTELCGSGWLVDGDPWYDATQGAFFKSPSVTEIYDAMNQAYEARCDQQIRDRARNFALAYDADHVMSTYWKPALAELTAAPAADEPSTDVFVREPVA